MPFSISFLTCSNSFRKPLQSVNNAGKSYYGVSFGKACQFGRGRQRGGKEEGVGAVGVGKAAGGEESSVANPRPGQRGDALREL